MENTCEIRFFVGMRETLAIYDAQSYLCSLKQYHRLLRHLQTSKPALLSQRVIHFEFESLLQSFGASYAFFERIYCMFNARLIRLYRFHSKEIFIFQF